MVGKRIASTVLALGLAVGGFVPLSGAFSAPAEAAAARPLHVGDRGPRVVFVQQVLKVRVTGYYGNETRAAVMHFQRWFKQPVTGTVTEATALKLLQVNKVKKRRAAPAPRRTAAPSSVGVQAIRLAAAQRGKPYVFGATGPRSFDCSGLTQYVYSRLGKRLPRTTWQQYAATKIPRNQLRPGDLVFSRDLSHVGIYAGYGSMWNAPHTGATVRLQRVYDGGYLVGRVR
jgi:cell wall-associated NlpC family hydrolase